MARAFANLSLTSHPGPALLRRARAAAIACQTSPEEAPVAIMFAAAAVEAALNDIGHYGARPGTPAAFQKLGHHLLAIEEAHGPTTLKIDAVYLQCSKTITPWGAKPLQDLEQLIWIRNQLSHPQPIHGASAESLLANKRVKFFLGRRLVSKAALAGHRTWDRVLLNAAVARWAANTALRTINSVLAELPPSSGQIELRRSWIEGHDPV